VGADPELYDQIHVIYSTPIAKVGELLLGAALLYHALNGLRIIVMDFWPATTVYHRQLWIVVWVAFFVIGIPVAIILGARIVESVG
jgi:succinate dehydrogenase / fumarate reductase cytochrome b subunit